MYACVSTCVWPLTASLNIETEGGLQLADVIVDADVQAVDSNRSEGVVEIQGVFIQYSQRADACLVSHTVGQKMPAHPQGRTRTYTHAYTCLSCIADKVIFK